MNKILAFEKNVFDTLHRIHDTYRKTVDSITGNYVTSCTQIDSRYRPEAAKEEKAKVRRQAQLEIDKARKDAVDLYTVQIDKIKAAVSNWAGTAPDAAFMDLLNTISKTGLKPSVAEMNTLAARWQGDYWGAKLLQQVANNNGYHCISAPDIERFERAISDIEGSYSRFFEMYLGSDAAAYDLHGAYDPVLMRYGDKLSFMIPSADNSFSGTTAQDLQKNEQYLLEYAEGVSKISVEPFFDTSAPIEPAT